MSQENMPLLFFTITLAIAEQFLHFFTVKFRKDLWEKKKKFIVHRKKTIQIVM